MELHKHISEWFEKTKSSEYLTPNEQSQVQRLLDYIEVLDKGHVAVTDDKTLLFHDFKSFFTQYDQRRGKNLIEIFPRLGDWYNSIELKKEFVIKQLNQHGITPPELGEYKE
jgi:hypothetical protein